MSAGLAGVLLPLAGVALVPAPRGAPAAITIATARGEVRVGVRADRGHPVVAEIELEHVLPVRKVVEGGWAKVEFAEQAFRFLLDAPVLVFDGRVVPMVGGAYVQRDSLFLPLQWLTDEIPRLFGEGYRYDPLAGRFEEARLAPLVTSASPSLEPPRARRTAAPPRYRPPSAAARRLGFRMQHRVAVDAGHGGQDPGNPGLFLPRGMQEKDVTLAVARLVDHELTDRGVEVLMSRTKDVYPSFEARTSLCVEDCDLFVSIHVNSLDPRRGFEAVNGIETYYLGDQLTENAQRVAAMENAALRYQADLPDDLDDPLRFILKDLHTNEFLRESALLADALQRNVSRRAPGGDRGVAQSNWYVLRYSRRPAALIEIGYATNRRDARFMAAPSGQREIAKAIADGIVTYLFQYEAKVLSGGGDR